MRRGAAAVFAVAVLGGCASQQPAKLEFGYADAAEGRGALWPPPPEVPRFAYAGQLVGEQNFKRQGEDPGKGFREFLGWLAGLVSGEGKPVVLQRPQSGVVDERSGRIYVTDVSRAAVFVFDERKGELQVWDKSEGFKGFISPIGIALGADSQVFVADADLGFVARLDENGNPLPGIGKNILKRPTGLAYDKQSKLLYVSDTHAHDIKVFDAQGNLARILGRRGEAAAEFNFPTYLTLWNGELYVTDTMNARVQVVDVETGAPVRQYGQRGLYIGNLVRPKGVAVDSESNVYIVESYYDHLLVFNNRGDFLMPIGGVGAKTGKFFLPAGVWVDSNNRIFVADTFNGRVAVFQFLGGDLEFDQ